MMKLLTSLFLLILVTLRNDGCTAPEITRQQQEVVNLCEARGGIPVLDTWGSSMVRCDFPPIYTIPQVEKSR